VNRRHFNRLSAMAALSFYTRLADAETFSYPWKLGIITDEVKPDLAETLKTFYPKYQLGWAEIRNLKINGKNKYVYKAADATEVKEIRKQRFTRLPYPAPNHWARQPTN
jgi:hypothetical protein